VIVQTKAAPQADTSQSPELRDYVDIVIKCMHDAKDSTPARKKKATKQEAALRRLKLVLQSRLLSESSAGLERLFFDASLDDDEALLRLMHGVDSNFNGSISKAELLSSPQLNEEMRNAFMAAFACKLEAVEEALTHIHAEDFGEYKQEMMMPRASGLTFSRKASVKAVFDALDPSASGWAKKEDLDSLATKLKKVGDEKLASALTALSSKLLAAEAELDFLDSKREARRVPRVTGPRVEWARRIGIDTALARHLPPGTLEDGLAGVRGMPPEEVGRAVEAFLEDARVRILGALIETKKARGSKSAAEANSKFSGGFQGNFATLEEFHKGAGASLNLGYPNPDTMKGIWYEHTQHPSAEKLFKTPNYSIVTNMHIEYAWAIFSENPDDREKKVLDNAFMHIRKLVKERKGAEEQLSTNEMLLFPGEVGDSFVESLVMLKFPASSVESDKKLGDAAKEIAVALLDNDGEKARGVAILNHQECMGRISKGRSVLQHEHTSQDAMDGSRHVGLLLPMSLARAQEILEELKAKVSTALSSEGVTTEVVGCKTWTFSRFTGVDGLRKWLEDQSMETLTKEVEGTMWSHVTPWKTHKQLCEALVGSFVRTELRADLLSALESASDAQMEALRTGWSLPQNGIREDLINQVAAVLFSEEWEKRWGEVEGWVRLHRGRIQGRTRLGLKALMEREEEKIEKYGLTISEVLAGHIYTGANFVPLNAICRSFPQSILDLLKGDGTVADNRMCTTLFCISSCLKKLSQFTELPENRCPPLQPCSLSWGIHPARYMDSDGFSLNPSLAVHLTSSPSPQQGVSWTGHHAAAVPVLGATRQSGLVWRCRAGPHVDHGRHGRRLSLRQRQGDSYRN
jgi:hypothetical protein